MKRFPDTYVIVFFITIIAAVLTFVLPGGQYTHLDDTATEPKFEWVDSQTQTWQVFSAFYNGFVRQAGIVVFIFIVGGAFWIVNKSRAVDYGILRFTRFLTHQRQIPFLKVFSSDTFILLGIIFIFSFFGAIFGMAEETIAFVLVFVPLVKSMGYDNITGVAIVFVASGLGFAGAMLNPFTIGIAQGISGLPLFSGLEYRVICWLIITTTGAIYIIRYTRKIKSVPEGSLEQPEQQNSTEFHQSKKRASYIVVSLITIALLVFSIYYLTTSFCKHCIQIPIIPALTVMFIISSILLLKKKVQFLVLNMLVFTILFLIVGVLGYQWYIMEIATLFLALGIGSGIACSFSPNKITALFLEGMKDILPASLMVGMAGGVITILEDGQVIDTILFYLSNGIAQLGSYGTVVMMYITQTTINVFIPSGSAQAALTMPVMAPLADLTGISRQLAVLIFQFGDGFTNLITPTSGVLLGVIGVAKIPYQQWFKWILPLVGILTLVGLILLYIPLFFQLNGW